MEIFKLENWQNLWGLIILVALPALFIFATYVFRKRKPSGKGLIPPQIVRWLLVPFLILFLILTQILSLSNELVFIKILETLISIIIISFLFNAINYLFFSEKNILTKQEILPKLGRDVLHIFLITLISACVLSYIWELDLGNLLTALGVGSLVIGLALQEPLGNLFNGISLLMASPFKMGDWIKIGEEVGKVAEINWRSVKIHTRFNEEIIIPNNLLGKEKIKNLSRPNKRYAEMVKIGFSYNDTPDKVKRVLMDVVTKNEKILINPPPSAIMLSYEDFSILYGLKFFIKDYEDIVLMRDEIIKSIYSAAKENGLTIPFPKREIDVTLHQKHDT